MPSNEPRDQLAGLRHALMRHVWSTPPVPDGLDTLVVAERILRDAELLDKLTAYWQAMRLSENAIPGGESLQDRWRGASASARKSEHHWPADCLAEAADVLDHMEGWRPPARRIETVDLDALPIGTVLLHSPCNDAAACVWVKDGDWWSANGSDAEYDSYDITSHIGMCAGPATLTVLHEPEEDRDA